MEALNRDIVKTLGYFVHVLNSNITLSFKKISFHLVNVMFFVAGHYGFKTLTLAPFFFDISTVFRPWTLRCFSNMSHLLCKTDVFVALTLRSGLPLFSATLTIFNQKPAGHYGPGPKKHISPAKTMCFVRRTLRF